MILTRGRHFFVAQLRFRFNFLVLNLWFQKTDILEALDRPLTDGD